MANSFKDAVENTPDISGGYRPGIQALGADSDKVSLANNRLASGSVDIDAQTKDLYHDDNRWDYAIGYNDKVYFVEVHPAQTSEVDCVLRKLAWLKQWLRTKATGCPEQKRLNDLPKGVPSFVWVQSGKCAILAGSKQAKSIAAAKLKLVPHLHLK